MPVDLQSVKSIFLVAVDLPATERSAHLDQACGDDAELRQRVEALLRAHDAPGSFYDGAADPQATGAFTPGPAPTDNPGESAGDRIGSYKLLQKLGEGGMGTVWFAEQFEPVRRQVALKVIKAGVDTAQVIARFEAERQALALMDHPNIAKVLDAGATVTGRPFFAMELVKGVPITQYCDSGRLSPRQRLELFIPVCEAVQHAHQKGLIHRDLKPSNVIIGLYDGRPVPKVIDFGVSKATQQRLTERTMFTEVGALIGTPEYMAPEQAELNNIDIDTRADVYALGVILYELLTGTPPFSMKQLRSAAFTEMLRMIREIDPPKPSTKLSSSDQLAGIAANRNLEPKRLTKAVSGDLDWIVMKCLEKERDRRYATANGLALELKRFLSDEPVLARPPSAGYRVRKFVRRNKMSVIGAGLVAIALIAGVIGTTWGMVRAQKMAAQVAKANEVLGSVFTDLDPNAEERDGTPLRLQLGERLEQASKQITDESIGDRLTVAGLQDILGWSQRGLGNTSQAILLLDRSLQTRQAELGPDHLLTLRSMDHLAGAFHDNGETKRAIALFEKALERKEALLGSQHRDTVETINNLALCCQDDGQLDRAVTLQERALDLSRKHFGDEKELIATCMNNLAMAYHHRGQVNRAIALYDEILVDRNVRLGPNHPQTLGTINNLALAHMDAKGLDKAQQLLERLVDGLKEKLGAGHPLTLTALNNLALAHHESGQVDIALPMFERTLEQRRARLGPDHQHTIVTMNNLAFAYRDTGQMDRAVPLFEAAFEKSRANQGSDNPDTLTCANNLALAYQSTGQNERARVLYEETLAKRQKVLGPDHQYTLITMHNVGSIWVATNRKDAGVAMLEDAANRSEANLGSDHPSTFAIWNTLADGYLKTERFADAEKLLRKSLELREKSAANHWTTAYARAMLGASLLGQKKYAEAEPLMLTSFAELKRTAANIPAPVRERRFAEALNNLIRMYEESAKPDEAAKWKKELEAIKPAPTPSNPGDSNGR